jgi:enoyl-CoA hydratase/carnithine racemase
MNFQAIGYEVTEGIATLTLNRPENLNAFNVPMMHELLLAFDCIVADDAVRAVIVTGAGRAFCAGADLSAGPDAFVIEEHAHAAVVRPDGSLNYASDGAGRWRACDDAHLQVP